MRRPWAFQSESQSGKLPAEQVSETMSEAAKQMGEAMKSGLAAAQKQGVPGADTMSEADARKLQQEMAQAGKSAGETLHVPRANVELFRKHEAELKKYAMHGLAFLVRQSNESTSIANWRSARGPAQPHKKPNSFLPAFARRGSIMSSIRFLSKRSSSFSAPARSFSASSSG